MAAANYISFDPYLNKCQLQQADEQNQKPHINPIRSSLFLPFKGPGEGSLGTPLKSQEPLKLSQ